MRVASVLLCSAFAGIAMTSLACESSNRDDRHVERTHTDAGDVTVTHDADRADRSDRSDLARSNIAAEIPTRARVVRTFNGHDTVAFRPDHSGMLYVTDTDRQRLIWSGRVDRDQRFELNPSNDAVTLDGQRLLDRPLNPDHSYRLYFDER